MPLLHMETELVRGVGNQLQQTAGSLQQQTQQLNNAVQNLANGWHGPSASIFVGEIQPMMQQLSRFANAGELLNQRLQREVDEWERVSSQFGSLGGSGVAAIANRTGLDGDGEEEQAFVKGEGEAHSVDPSDVTQGALGDCYLMASMAAIANQNPDLIQKLIHDNGDGTYTVTFYQKKKFLGIFDDGYEKIKITVDADFPEHNGSPMYAQPGDTVDGKQEIWGMVIEKAYADWKGGYEDIEGGWPHDAFEALTGVDSKDYKPSSMSFQDLAARFQDGEAIAVASHFDRKLGPFDIPDSTDSNSFYQDDTLVAGHAYYISDVNVQTGTITIRNPWGWDHPEIVMTYDEYKDAFQKVTINPLN